jgi:hypothetical protein
MATENCDEVVLRHIQETWSPKTDSPIMTWIKSCYDDPNTHRILSVDSPESHAKWNLDARVYPVERIANVALLSKGMDMAKIMGRLEWLRFALADAVYSALPTRMNVLFKESYAFSIRSLFASYPDSIEEFGIVLSRKLRRGEFSILALGAEVPKVDDLRRIASNLDSSFTHRNQLSIGLHTALSRNDGIPFFSDEEGLSRIVSYVGDQEPYIYWGRGRELKRRGRKLDQPFEDMLRADWAQIVGGVPLKSYDSYNLASYYALFANQQYILKPFHLTSSFR